MIIAFFILSTVNCQIQYRQTGCQQKCPLDSVCTCTQCPIGIQNCLSTQLLCQPGYFLYKQSYCVQCPYQQYQQIGTLYCMDCFEHPLTWDLNRQCTYQYTIPNGDLSTGVYINQVLDVPTLYFVVNISNQLTTQQCEGCNYFCSNPDLDSSCNRLSNPVDQNIALVCSSGFYFQNDQCSPCQKNCMSCPNNICDLCIIGYYLQDGQCQQCQGICQSCINDAGYMCIQCPDGFVPSIDFQTCQQCDNTCSRCEYVVYGSQILYPTRTQKPEPESSQLFLRCRQCLDPSSFISYDGVQCEPCTISNCKQCYYDLPESQYTYNVDFTPQLTITQYDPKCLICENGFQLDSTGSTCSSATLSNNCQSYINSNCVRCDNGFIFEELTQSCSGKCTSKLPYCINCMKYQDAGLEVVDTSGNIIDGPKLDLYQCIQCEPEYYADFFTGFCNKCPQNCLNCWQYTLSYNFTEYLTYQTAVLTDNDKVQYTNEEVLAPYCSRCKDGFQLYQNGQCLGCTSDCEFNDENMCLYQEQIAFCQKCPSPFNQQSLTADLSQCSECPTNCIACRDRTPEENFNTLFSPSNQNLIKFSKFCYKLQTVLPSGKQVYLDTSTFLPITCSSTMKQCQTESTITVYVFCDDDDFTLNLAEKPDQANYYYQLSTIFSSNPTAILKFSKIESYSLYDSLNQATIYTLNLIIKFKGDKDGQCQFKRPTQLTTQFQKNIYSLTEFNVMISSFDSNKVTFIQQGLLQFTQVNKVSFTNIDFQYQLLSNSAKPVFKYGIQIQSPYNQFELIQSNVQKVVGATFQILLQNTFKINIQYVQLQGFNNEDTMFKQSFNQTNNFSITILNLTLLECQIINKSFLLLNPMGFNFISIQNFNLQQSNIYNSSILSFQQFNNYVSFNLSGGNINFNYFENSSFIQASNIQQTSISNLVLLQNVFNYSNFIQSDNFQISNIYFYKCQLYNQSTLIQAQNDYTGPAQYIKAIQQYNLQNIIFDSCQCFDINCLIILNTPLNKLGMVTSISLQYITIINTVIDIDITKLSSVTSALLYLNNLYGVTISYFKSDNNLGITILTTQNIGYFDANNLTFDWSQPNYIDLEIDQQAQDLFNIQLPSGKVLNPINNLIPVNENCLLGQIQSLNQNYFNIYISNYQKGVRISNTYINRMMHIDASSIYIESQNILVLNTTQEKMNEEDYFFKGYQQEIVIIQNLQVLNNTLLKYDQGSQISILQIVSTQQQKIQILNVNFQSNHLHQYTSQLLPSTTCILIQSPYASVTLNNSIFQYNRATKSQLGIISIQADWILIQKTTFSFTNILEEGWYYRLGENQFKSNLSYNLQEFFTILSNGANLFVQSANLTILQSTFSNSFGLNGNGIFIQTLGSGFITINYTNFINLQGSLEAKYSTYGGCMYVDSGQSGIDFFLYGSQFQNCISRSQGGCLFFENSKNKNYIWIMNTNFEKCQSLDSSFMYSRFPDSSVATPTVQIQDVQVSNNNMVEFLSKVPQLAQQEINALQIQSSCMRQRNGILYMSNVLFTELNYVSILFLFKLITFSVANVQVNNCLMFLLPLISITIDPVLGSIQFSNSRFNNNTFYDNISSSNQCVYLDSFYYKLSDQTCDVTTSTLLYINMVTGQEQIQQDSTNPVTYNLYDEIILDQFKNVDYQWKFYVTPTPIPLNIYNIQFQAQQNLSIAQCVLSQIYNSFTETKICSFLYLVGFTQQNTLNAVGLKITQNKCKVCYAFLQLLNVDNGVKTINITDMNYESNIGGYSGCFIISSETAYTDVRLTQNIYNQRLLQQLFIDLLNKNLTVLIQNSVFVNNTAQVGAAFSIVDINTLLINNSFSNNKAQLVGGTLYFENSKLTSTIVLYQNYFENNKAQVGAAMYLYQVQAPDLTLMNNTFKSNTASMSSSNLYEATRSQTISMVNGQLLETQIYIDNVLSDNGTFISSDQSYIKEIIQMKEYQIGNYPNKTTYLILPSGQQISSYSYYYSYTEEKLPFAWNFRIINKNKYSEQVINQQNGAICQVQGRIQDSTNYSDTKTYFSNYTTPNQFYYNQSKGGYDLDKLVVIFDPKADSKFYLELQFLCPEMKIPIYNQTPPYDILGYNTHYSLIANIRTFPCQLGEVYSNQQCVACSGNTYNVDLTRKFCQQIDTLSTISITPYQLNLMRGYWRPFTTNDKITYCINNPSVCKGGWNPGDRSCTTGQLGALCEQCDLYNVRGNGVYAQTKSYNCGTCDGSRDQNIQQLIGTSIANIGTTMISVKATYDSVRVFLVIKSLTLMGSRLDTTQGDLANYMKIIMNYFQIIQVLGTFQLTLPDGLVQVTSAIADPGQQNSKSLDCLYKDISDINVIYFGMIWQVIQPLLYLSAFLLQYFFGVLFLGYPFQIGLVYTAFIYMFMLMQPTLISGFISLASQRIVSNLSYVQSNVGYLFNTNTHQSWVNGFAAPMILLWAFILPLSFFYLVYRKRHYLYTNSVRKNLGFFYNEYSQSTYYWEFIKLFQKELLFMFLTFYQDYVVVKGTLATAILFFYTWAQFEHTPYKSGDLNHSDRYSSITCLVSILFGVLAYQSLFRGLDYLAYIIYAFIAIINLMFLLYIIRFIIYGYLIKYQDKYDPIRQRINAMFPRLKSDYPFLKKYLEDRSEYKKRVKKNWGVIRKYFKQQVENGHSHDPKYELLINAKFDFQQARNCQKSRSATIKPINGDNQMLLGSELADIGKNLIETFKQETQKDKNSDGKVQDTPQSSQTGFLQLQKDNGGNNNAEKEQDQGGIFGTLKGFLPDSIKKSINDVEEKKKQLENIKKEIDQKKQMFNNLMGNSEQQEQNQTKNKEDEQPRKDQESGGLLSTFRGFLPDSINKQINAVEEKKKQLENIQQEFEEKKQMLNQFVGNSQQQDQNSQQSQDQQEQNKKVEEKGGLLGSLKGFLPDSINKQISAVEEKQKQFENIKSEIASKQQVFNNFLENSEQENQPQQNTEKQTDKQQEQGGIFGSIKGFLPDINKQISAVEDLKSEISQKQSVFSDLLGNSKPEQQQQNTEQQDDKQPKESGGIFGSLKGFLPDSINKQIDSIQEKKVQLENFKEQLDEKKQMVDKFAGSTLNQLGNIQQNESDLKSQAQDTIFGSMKGLLPDSLKKNIDEIEEKKQQLNEFKQQIDEKAQFVSSQQIPNTNGDGLFSQIKNLMPEQIKQSVQEIENKKSEVADIGSQLQQRQEQLNNFVKNSVEQLPWVQLQEINKQIGEQKGMFDQFIQTTQQTIQNLDDKKNQIQQNIANITQIDQFKDKQNILEQNCDENIIEL